MGHRTTTKIRLTFEGNKDQCDLYNEKLPLFNACKSITSTKYGKYQGLKIGFVPLN